MTIISRLIIRLGLGLALSFGVGACEEDPDLEASCANRVGLIASCAEMAFDCEVSPCYEDCTSLGEGASDFSDTCGKLWIKNYDCFAEMSCEGVKAWTTAVDEDTFDYPCGKLESEFRKLCPDIPLYSPMN